MFILEIDIQDNNKDTLSFLNKDGNPYDYVEVDKFGFVAMEFGVIGIPETFW